MGFRVGTGMFVYWSRLASDMSFYRIINTQSKAPHNTMPVQMQICCKHRHAENQTQTIQLISMPSEHGESLTDVFTDIWILFGLFSEASYIRC